MAHHSNVDTQTVFTMDESKGGDIPLNRRELATLRAVALGQAEISCSRAPDLFIDGLACCDQSTARRLASLGLVVSACEGINGARVPAMLSEAGKMALESAKGKVLVA